MDTIFLLVDRVFGIFSLYLLRAYSSTSRSTFSVLFFLKVLIYRPISLTFSCRIQVSFIF